MNNLFRLTAFPKSDFGGNKAGVYINADDLSDSAMQKIAKEVNYSETAFVMKSNKADFKVRFFTPTSEVNLCGHATIATFNLLRDLNIIKPGIYKQETKAGILKLDVRDNFVFMQQVKPVFSEVINIEEIKNCFKNIEFNEILKPQVVSTGIREIFLPVKNIEVLNRLEPHFDELISLANKYSTIGIHAFALDDYCDAYGRNFAPVVGVFEESATGTSNGALACYLYQYQRQKENFVLRQGYSMNQPSEIIVDLKILNNKIAEVWVGGKAKII